MWELLTGLEPYADLHYGAIIGNFPAESNCDLIIQVQVKLIVCTWGC